MLHTCPHCRSNEVHVSRQLEWRDVLAGFFLLSPLRCHRCLRRFYGFQKNWARLAFRIALYLAPALLLTVWFVELRHRSYVPVVPAEPVAEKPMDQMLHDHVRDMLANPDAPAAAR